jgi:glycosyltransferase involved in cell wall biosynthesis
MKVYILTAVPFPNGMAPTNRIKCYAKALIGEGVDCKVICFRRSDIESNKERNGIDDGVPFQYIGRNSLHSKNAIRGKLEDIIDHLLLLFYLLFKVKKNTIVFSYGSTLHYGNMLISVTHLKRGVFVRDLVEMPNVTANDTPKQKRIREQELTTQFPRYDGVVAISEALEKMATEHMSKENAVLRVPILVDYDKYSMEDMSDKADCVYVFHSGKLTEQKDGIVGMIEAFAKAQKKMPGLKVRFYSTGDANKSRDAIKIKNVIEKYGVGDSIRFLGYLTDDELKGYLQRASLVIINKYRTEQNVYCFSTKLGEYMAAGKPVIITKIGEAMNWLKHGYDSYIVEPEDNEALSDAIETLLTNKPFRKMIGNNGRETCKRCFGYDNYGKTLVDFFSSLMR